MSKELKINGYQIFKNEDDAVYIAKSKEDVYEYFVENYGSTEDCQNQTKDKFINELIDIELDSKPCQIFQDWYNDETGETTYGGSSYYDEYKKYAELDKGTNVIAYLCY